MATPFIIDDQVRTDIRRLIEQATVKPVPFKRLQEYASGVRPIPVNYNADATIAIPIAFKATYTHEEHKPGVICRHLSVSVERRDRIPNEHAMQMLLDEFGFVNKLVEYDNDQPNEGIVVRASHRVLPPKLALWEEKFIGGVAINIMEPLDGDFSKLQK